MIGIVNYGMGNLASVQNALDHLNIPNRLICAPAELRDCRRVIIPGVGAFAEAMRKLSENGFTEELQEFALHRQQPVLGICLGMQLMLESSVEHGIHKGLGLVRGTVEAFSGKVERLVVPHVGWNELSCSHESTLLKDIDSSARVYYFVHSYYCKVAEATAVKGKVEYGVKFDGLFEVGNLFGVQFHPEKSQRSGLQLLKNFGKQ